MVFLDKQHSRDPRSINETQAYTTLREPILAPQVVETTCHVNISSNQLKCDANLTFIIPQNSFIITILRCVFASNSSTVTKLVGSINDSQLKLCLNIQQRT